MMWQPKLKEVYEIPHAYDIPKMVCFYDPDIYDWLEEPKLLIGIAVDQKFICSCCGSVYYLSEIGEYSAPAIGYHEFEEWLPLDEIQNYWEDIKMTVAEHQQKWQRFCQDNAEVLEGEDICDAYRDWRKAN